MHLQAKYLILHGKDELETDRIFKLSAKGPRFFSKNDLLKKDYPEPKGELYVVFQIERDASDDFEKNRFKRIDSDWNIQKFGQTVFSDFIGSA